MKHSDETNVPLYDKACSVCDFKLSSPITTLKVSDLVLYNDSRFPGRSILALRQHFDAFEDVPADLMHQFMEEVQKATRAIKSVTGCARVNIAILGNKVPHVHAHLIPRYPLQESDPHRASWRDTRPQTEMPPQKTQEIIASIQSLLSDIGM